MPENLMEMKSGGTILIVDDEIDLLEGLARILEEEQIKVVTTTDPEEVCDLVRKHKPDVTLTDFKMPKKNGFELLAELSQIAPDMPVVMISAYATGQGVVEAVKRGAFDYLIKPFNTDQLLLTVRRALAYSALLKEREALASALHEGRFQNSFAGANPLFMQSVRLVKKVAHSTVNVFIQGEAGVGKELAARLIHFSGSRSDKPFSSVNCATLVEAPFDDKAGESALWSRLFSATDGGTLYLTHLEALSASLQGKLLAELTKRKQVFQGTADDQSRIRIIASSCRSKNGEVASLHKDLYTALAVVVIEIPPLRQRKDDLPALVQFFLSHIAAKSSGTGQKNLSAELLPVLQEYDWPGNVRELETMIEQAVRRSSGETISLDDFPKKIRAGAGLAIRDYKTAKKWCLDQFERQYIEQLLIACHGNISKASEKAGLARMSLYRMMRRTGMSRGDLAYTSSRKRLVNTKHKRK